jgi:uncharacterized membrane protein YdjX (TVP38/TMEM64 family)
MHLVESDKPAADKGCAAPGGPGPYRWRRLAPLGVLAAAALAVFLSGLHEELSPRAIADSRELIQDLVSGNRAGAIGLYMIVYASVVAMALPFGAMLTILGGFLFGPITAGLIVIFAATTGATALFLAARTALGDLLTGGSGRLIGKMRKGFQDNALSYMLFLRLVPAFPFALVNIAPAILGVHLRTYLIGTFLGIIPGTFAYAWVGGSLDSILVKASNDPAFQACLAKEKTGELEQGSCSLGLQPGDFIQTDVIVAIVLLGVVALIPAVWRMVRRKSAGGE